MLNTKWRKMLILIRRIGETNIAVVDKASKVTTYASEKLEEESAHRDERYLYRQASRISMTILRSISAYSLHNQHKMRITERNHHLIFEKHTEKCAFFNGRKIQELEEHNFLKQGSRT